MVVSLRPRGTKHDQNCEHQNAYGVGVGILGDMIRPWVQSRLSALFSWPHLHS